MQVSEGAKIITAKMTNTTNCILIYELQFNLIGQKKSFPATYCIKIIPDIFNPIKLERFLHNLQN